jgi:hypothetical protein
MTDPGAPPPSCSFLAATPPFWLCFPPPRRLLPALGGYASILALFSAAPPPFAGSRCRFRLSARFLLRTGRNRAQLQFLHRERGILCRAAPCEASALAP